MSPELAATHWGTALLHWLPLPLQLSPCWTKPVCGTIRLAFESVLWMAALRGLTFLLQVSGGSMGWSLGQQQEG